MTDLAKLLSVFARTKQDYYSFSDDDSYGNITNYVIIIQDGIMVTFEFITYLEWEADKAQMFKGMTTENVDFRTLGEYIAYRYDLELAENVAREDKHDFCNIEEEG